MKKAIYGAIILFLLIISFLTHIDAEIVSNSKFTSDHDILIRTSFAPGYGSCMNGQYTSCCLFIGLEPIGLLFGGIYIAENTLDGFEEDSIVYTVPLGISLLYCTVSMHIINYFDTYWQLKRKSGGAIKISKKKTALLSFFCPGLGHFLLNQRAWGFAYLFATTASAYAAFQYGQTYKVQTVYYKSEYGDYMNSRPGLSNIYYYPLDTRIALYSGLILIRLLDTLHAYYSSGKYTNKQTSYIIPNATFANQSLKFGINIFY